jgi:beta-galactosidase
MKRLLLIIPCVCLASVVSLKAAMLTATVQTPPPAESGYFKLGTTRNPSGHELSVNSRSVLLDGQPWFPAMGEFHYSRYPQNEWRDELLKVKAGGVDIVATYVFWIHHEEIEGQFDWSGQRDLRKFVQLCGEVGLKVVVRCGPWCHGEVRNGGLPDWVQAHNKKDWKLRSTDTNFLAAVQILYGQIGAQLKGLLWKDGGPVIGIQVDNEFGGSPDYLMALKQIAIDAGLDVPFYTKTGWPATRSPMPLGELLPLFGTYADGFWDRDLTVMGGDKWMRFVFSKLRTDAAIANDLLGNRKAADEADTEKYPYLTCEIGGGMETSYHRRILVEPRDIESVVLVQLGSGSSLLGYYMYHGGQNPEGKLTTLNESQATGYPNDLPVKDYDFQAPLGEYGQINPQYHWLRRLHLFLRDFGGTLAQMPVSLPDVRPTNRTDLATLRWAVRSDGRSGFVFVNNYQRLQPMPPQKEVQFKLNLPGGELVFPSKPVKIPADSFFLWPFNLDLGGVKLVYATAQPVCRVDDTFFFAEIPGVKAEFVFDPTTLVSAPADFRRVKPGRDAAIRLQAKSGAQIQIVLLNEADSLALWKGEFAGRERVVLSHAGIVFDGGALKVTAESPKILRAEIFPALQNPAPSGGIFSRLDLPKSKKLSSKATFELVKSAGPLREIPRSTGKAQLALAPVESDFTNAAVWKIKLPANLDLNLDPILRIHYAGDVARLTLNGRLIDDNFYNGKPFDLGLKRFAPEVLNGDLRLAILPLCQDTPIYLAAEARPKFGKAASMARVNQLEVVNRYCADFKPSFHRAVSSFDPERGLSLP